jgi:hypothetical protein
VNQTFGGGVQGGQAVVHEGDYSIGTMQIRGWHSVSRCSLW